MKYLLLTLLLVPISIIDLPREPIRIEAIVTAYTSLPELTDSTPFHTADGSKTEIGIIACPRKYHFNTWVLGLGEPMRCADRMNRRYEGEVEHFDIWLPTLKEAKKFGRQKLTLYIFL